MSASTSPRSLRALLKRLIDYAGLFPPANLDMAVTVKNYAEYLRLEDGWMLGRLIVPVARLEEFEHHAAALLPKTSADAPDLWQITALASAIEPDQLAADLDSIEDFNLRHEDEGAGRAIIDVIELKADSVDAIDAALEIISDDLFPFVEVPIDRDPASLLAALAEGDAGAKSRTGGVTADLYPSPAALARFIAACAEVNVPFKATAGMHHPLRHFSEMVQADEFGFLNVFIAACLAQSHELGQDDLQQVLEERSLEAFEIDDQGIAWRSLRVETASIEDVREEFAISFGSCSFDEPREEMRALGLL